MIHIIIQILVFQLLFLVVYDLFLDKETFFNLNRIYLLLTPLLSVGLPFVSLGFVQQNIPQEYIVQLPAILINETIEGSGSNSIFALFTLKNLWIAGAFISALIFCFKISKLLKLKSSAATRDFQGKTLRILPKTDSAFSFFDTIYLGENISEENRNEIIAHERVHIQQKHSLDLLYFELLRIVFWFNPLVYLFQNRITTLHEYIADAEIIRTQSKKQYYQNLLSEVFQTERISFVNTFFTRSLIKKRIIMLQKSKSQKINLMKYLMLLPILGAMVIYTSCTDTSENLQGEEQVSQEMPPPPPPPPPNRESGIVNGEVPYSVIEQVPTYPGCSGDNETMRKCMSSKIAESINSNFNTSIANDLNLSGRQRIAVQFKIDKTGNVTDVRARAKHPELETEAMRVVNLLPQMKPGEQKGEKVAVLYSLPIVFDVQ